MRIDVKTILEKRLAESLGLDKYQYIMDHVMNTDVSKESVFQRTFNGFYIVRRNEEWRRKYYSYFESIKHTQPTFEEILTYLYKNTGNIELSFSSKMLATILPEKPIWDKYVVKNLNIKLVGNTKEEKLKNAISLYDEIEKWYLNYLESDDGKECIREFEQYLPNYKWVHDIKKLDTLLWSIR